MRVDRWIRNTIGKIPQGFIEKSLRLGKIKVNKKKVKSSYKNLKREYYQKKLVLILQIKLLKQMKI